MFGFKNKKAGEEWMREVLEEILGTTRVEDIAALVEQVKEIVGPADQISQLKKDLLQLRLEKDEQVKTLKLDRDIEERDLKHLIKIKEEQVNFKGQTRELELKSEFKDKEMKMQKEYFEKSLKQLDGARNEMNHFFSEVMKRLPNVNMEINKDTVITQKV
jgi:hypothetical protein